MAKVGYSPIITDLHRASSPGKIHRQKTFRDGKIYTVQGQEVR